VLARIGEFKVSSSSRFLIFAGIEIIGQAFADEIFRVFQNAHPDIQLEVVNATPDALNTIQHVSGRAWIVVFLTAAG
jgi:hypothetical protein